MTVLTKQDKQHYSESFKRKVIQEYLDTGTPKMSLLKKYDIKMKSGIQRWMRQFGYEDIHQKARYSGITNFSSLAKKKREGSSGSEQRLEGRIKELERQLEDEQLRSEAYMRMIEIAEKEFHIPIRKKPNTK